MAQYQSFPGAPGDSLTLEKLKVLGLPELSGRSFLDVGCNEGFFCGFAKFQGAARAVGLDHSAGFVERARKRFPDCEFFARTWDELPDGPFDVILLASALHYADDQAALLHRLINKLSPDGVLVLELGIVTSTASEWVKVKRGIDERYFPTMPKLKEVLADYAWKWMGPSVSQAGDPVARHVIHISRRRPVAYLLLQPPAYGKTSVADRLFKPAGVRVVSGDHQIGRAAKGELSASPALREAIASVYSPFRIDQTVQKIFALGLSRELVELWTSQAGSGDFALDAYVPTEQHATVERLMAEAGYLPVLMRWDRVGPKLQSSEVLAAQGEAFYLSMASAPSLHATAATVPASTAHVGFVDEVDLIDGQLRIRGWAVDEAGNLPAELLVRVGVDTFTTTKFEKQLRPDVQAHLSVPHALVGYVIRVDAPDLGSTCELNGELEVRASRGGTPLGGRFQLAGALAKKLQR